MQENVQKALKKFKKLEKLYFFFQNQSFLMDKIMKKGPKTSDQSLFRS